MLNISDNYKYDRIPDPNPFNHRSRSTTRNIVQTYCMQLQNEFPELNGELEVVDGPNLEIIFRLIEGPEILDKWLPKWFEGGQGVEFQSTRPGTQ